HQSAHGFQRPRSSCERKVEFCGCHNRPASIRCCRLIEIWEQGRQAASEYPAPKNSQPSLRCPAHKQNRREEKPHTERQNIFSLRPLITAPNQPKRDPCKHSPGFLPPSPSKSCPRPSPPRREWTPPAKPPLHSSALQDAASHPQDPSSETH